MVSKNIKVKKNEKRINSQFFISTSFIRAPNKFQTIKHFWMVFMNFKDIK